MWSALPLARATFQQKIKDREQETGREKKEIEWCNIGSSCQPLASEIHAALGDWLAIVGVRKAQRFRQRLMAAVLPKIQDGC